MNIILLLWALVHFTFTESTPVRQTSTDLKVSPTISKRQTTRTWRVRGPNPTGFPNNGAANTTINEMMRSFMQYTSATQAQISVAKAGKQIFNHAFTWDVPASTTTEVDDVFLLASLSKIYLVAAIQVLLNTATSVVKPGLKVYRQLGYKTAKDARVFDITVQNLLEHKGGDNRDASGDPTYNMRNIAIKMSAGNRPASVRDIIEYKLQEMLDYTPGTGSGIYSNYGYVVLSYLVQNVTSSSSYYTYLSQKVLTPQGFDVRQWLTDSSYHTNDRVKQQDPYTGLSALNPKSNVPVPYIYGGDGMYKESAMGSAALASSASTLTRTVAKYPVWGWQNGRAPGYIREGSTPGARTRVESRWDGLDVAIVVNTRNFDDVRFTVLAEELNNYLNAQQPTI